MSEIYLRPIIPVRTGLVAGNHGEHRRAMGAAVWLFLLLLALASPTSGERLVDPAKLGQLLGAPEATVRTWIGQLRKAGYLAVAREGRNLWVRILRWSPEAPPEPQIEPVGPQPGPGSPGTALKASTLAERLGEPLRSPLMAQMLSEHPPERIQEVLDEVMAIPQERIKKSRAALMAYLLRNQ